MKGERTTDRDALTNRYGLNTRLAARIVALLAKKIDVSETILESAGSEESVKDLLLHKSLLKEPENLTESWIQERAAEKGYEDAELLRLVEGENGWRTVALEDDVLAAEARTAAGKEEPTSMIKSPAGGISRKETEELFAPEEVAQIKLSALTSQNDEERIEALRKLVFVPLPGSEKANVFVNVLIDSSASVAIRREAVRSLEQIGFRTELAECVRRVFEADHDEVMYALERLGALIKDAEDAEIGIGLAVVLQLFDDTDDPDILRKLLSLIQSSADVLALSREKTENFIQTALRQLTRNFTELSVPVDNAFEVCHEHNEELVEDVLWKELDRSTDARVRSYIIRTLGDMAESPERVEELAKAAVSAILDPDLPEDQRSYLRYGLLRMGEAAVDAAQARIYEESGRRRAELVRLIDVLCSEGEVSRETLNEAVRVLVDMLQVGERSIRRMILEATCPTDSRVDDDLQEQVATELLSHMNEFKMQATIDIISRTLEQIGPVALKPLVSYVKRRFPQESIEPAFRSIGHIARDWGPELPDEPLEEIHEFCIELLEDEDTEDGGFTIALACLCGYSDAGKKWFVEALNKLQDRIGKVAYSFDIFEALGIMAGSPNAEIEQQKDLFNMFDSILTARAPAVLGIERDTADGTVYEFGSEVEFNTRVLPSVVRGLERIAVSEGADAELRRKIAKRLLVLWEGVSKVRIVWGPAGVGALVQAMSSTACYEHADTQMRIRLARSLLKCLNKVGVVRSLGEICSAPDESGEMQELCTETAEQMIDEWENADQQDEERRVAILKALGKIGANIALDAEDEVVQRTRENILDVLYQGIREGIDQVYEPLERMRDCPDLGQETRDKIRERLNRAFGLTRIKPKREEL
ncbi:MAG: hypothetical protein KGZ25_00255 [Planctomycetes bacterium]|nr:hypothetical protein [Planctomycetota bacterium]